MEENKTNNKVKEIVEEFAQKCERLTPAGGFKLELDGSLSQTFIIEWLRQALTSSYEIGFEDGKNSLK